MRKGADNPTIPAGKTVREALFVITAKGVGATAVVSTDGTLLGLITDGDIRRGFAKGNGFLDLKVEDFMTRTPRTITCRRAGRHSPAPHGGESADTDHGAACSRPRNAFGGNGAYYSFAAPWYGIICIGNIGC